MSGTKLDSVRTLMACSLVPSSLAGPEGGYPMHHAARRGCDQTLNLLFQKGGDPRPHDPWQEPVISCGWDLDACVEI